MNARTRLSSKGQVVIPKDIRDALRLHPGDALRVSCHAGKVIIEAEAPQGSRIDYAEFRRRVPAHAGRPVPVEEMTSKIGELFRGWKV